MAKAGKDALTRGLSGMIGKVLVFRRVGNETIVSAAPAKRSNWSAAQKQLRNRFKEAAAYARMQMLNPVIKAAYANSVKDKPTRTAYHAALTDFLNPPEVSLPDGNVYTNIPHNVIRVLAEDDFRVTNVKVQIFATDGRLLEEGGAVQQASGLEWIYAATQILVQTENYRVRVTAYDMPGNKGVIETVL